MAGAGRSSRRGVGDAEHAAMVEERLDPFDVPNDWRLNDWSRRTGGCDVASRARISRCSFSADHGVLFRPTVVTVFGWDSVGCPISSFV